MSVGSWPRAADPECPRISRDQGESRRAKIDANDLNRESQGKQFRPRATGSGGYQ